MERLPLEEIYLANESTLHGNLMSLLRLDSAR